MKNFAMHGKPFGYASVLLLVAAISIAPAVARAQSPADGQTPGAAINDSINGTTPLPNPADQLGKMGGVNSVQQAAIDKMFVKKAMQDNLTAMQLGDLTLHQSSNEQVKQFARKSIDDHTKLNEQMRPIAQQLGVEIPTEVSKKDKSLIGKMQSVSGPAYDQAYIKETVKGHKQDLSEYRREVSNSPNVGIKNAASQGSETISAHLASAEQLAKDQNIDLARK